MSDVKWKRKKGTRDYIATIGGCKVKVERSIVAGAQVWRLYIDGERVDPRGPEGLMRWNDSLDAAKARAEQLIADGAVAGARLSAGLML